MQEVHIMGESLKFMVLGMAVVYAFLLVLIELMKLQAKIIAKYFPEKVILSQTPTPKVVPHEEVLQHDDESMKTAAIIAAIAEFKKSNHNKKV